MNLWAIYDSKNKEFLRYNSFGTRVYCSENKAIASLKSILTHAKLSSKAHAIKGCKLHHGQYSYLVIVKLGIIEGTNE